MARYLKLPLILTLLALAGLFLLGENRGIYSTDEARRNKLFSIWRIPRINILGSLYLVSDKGITHKTEKDNFPKHVVLFYDDELFKKGVLQTQDVVQEAKIVGAVIPHHLLPSFILSDFFKRLSYQNPTTIILVGPNHYEKGDFKVLTSKFGWQTVYGDVLAEEEIIDTIIESNLAKIDEEVIVNEHSVSGIMPYLKYYLPYARAIPLILSSKMTLNDNKKLADFLASYVSPDIVIIGSIDFSHYLTRSKAQASDKVTLSAMKRFDFQKLESLNNDYLDSPDSLITVLMAMKELGYQDFNLLYNTNSGIILKNDQIETTSYFSFVFEE